MYKCQKTEFKKCKVRTKMVYVLLHKEPDMTFLNSTLDVKVKRYNKIALFLWLYICEVSHVFC